MRCFFSGDERLDREQVLCALKGSLEGVVGFPVRLREAQFVDLPLADFFASDPQGRLFAVRWLEAREFASRLFEILGLYARLHGPGRAAFARALGLAEDFAPLTLILVSDALGDAWSDVASTLRIPVVGLRVHPLLDGAGGFSGCFFERRFGPADLGVADRGVAALAEPQAPAPAAPRNQDAVPASSRRRSPGEPGARQRETGARIDPAERVVVEPAPQPLARTDREGPAAGLSDEEAATFKLLEAVLTAAR